MRNEIFVRCRKGTRVVELKIETARKNVHRGWIIEDPRYTHEGHLIGQKKEVEQQEIKPVVKKEIVREKIEIKIDQSDLIEKIEKMRSLDKLNNILEGDYDSDVKFAAQTRIDQLNK